MMNADPVARYRAASEANDVDAIMGTVTPQIELVSPLSARAVFRGEHDCRILFDAIYASIRDFRWVQESGDAHTRVLVGEGHVGPFHLGDAMILELAPDGRIQRIRPHLRPWLGTTYLALALAIRLARRPGTLLRAMRAS